MLTFFNCPDGITRPISDCLNKCPRPEGRCLSLPTLTSIGSPRIWRGRPSTTQLLNPTRLEYLQVKKPYAVDPFDQAFALLGTRHHGRLEQVAKHIEGLESELVMKGEVSGIVDLLEPLTADTYRLIDYKTYGSYSAAKHLGIKEDKDNADQHKLELQMNNYRLLAKAIGFDVRELKCQITVRDGGTFAAKHNGIEKNLYLIDVNILPDNEVESYFHFKKQLLCEAIETTTLPPLCPYEERWGGRRCKGFCNVVAFCPEGAKVKKVELQQ